mgnify:FL=1
MNVIKKTMRHLALKGEVCDGRSSFGCSRNHHTINGVVFVKFLDIIDSNVLFRIIISGGKILKLLFDNKLRIFAPLKLKEELIKHKDEILLKSKLSENKFNAFSAFVLKRIIFVPLEEYSPLIPKARELLGKHSKDEDFIALCLFKNIKVWTYEKLLFDLGFGMSTKQISEALSNLT